MSFSKKGEWAKPTNVGRIELHGEKFFLKLKKKKENREELLLQEME